MRKISSSLDDVKNRLMQNEDFKFEYEREKERRAIIEQIAQTRKDNRVTQEQLANLIGTKKSNISRFEKGETNPSLDFIIRIADALGLNLKLLSK